jgi:hypothetical protein
MSHFPSLLTCMAIANLSSTRPMAYPSTRSPSASAPGLTRNSHSPVIARTSPVSPMRRVSASRGSDSRDPENKTPSGHWPGRYSASYSTGFGSSNERGVAEEEAIDDGSSVVETPESQIVARRRKPALKLEEAVSNKKPRCTCIRGRFGTRTDQQWTISPLLVHAPETGDATVQEAKQAAKAVLPSTTTSPMSRTSWHRAKVWKSEHARSPRGVEGWELCLSNRKGGPCHSKVTGDRRPKLLLTKIRGEDHLYPRMALVEADWPPLQLA